MRERANLKILSDTIVRLLRRNATSSVRKIVAKTHSADLAHILQWMKRDERRDFCAELIRERRLGETLFEADESEARDVLATLSDDEVVKALLDLADDQAVDLLGFLPEERAGTVLKRMRQVAGVDLAQLLSYDEETAGGRMSQEYVALPSDMNVGNAIRLLRETSEARRILYVYVIDDAGRLVGVLSLRDLIMASTDDTLDSIMQREVVRVETWTGQEDVARVVSKFDLLAVPVVDDAGTLVGIITVDDVIDVISDEVTDDIYRMAGTSSEELVYGDQIVKIARIRLPWLIVNLFGGLLSGYILHLFRASLEEAIVLASFVPVIAGMGGNIGAQSASITVRGLAVGRVDLDRIWQVVSKEVRVGALMGVVCGLIVGLVGSIWNWNPFLGIVVGISMFFAITVAALTGTLAPATFKRIGVDPAIASGPFVTTANDITGLMIYLSLATVLIRHLR